MSTDIKLKVTEIQRFCMHDGPGVRTTVFLKGCPLRCAWCHNPETQKVSSELLFYQNKCIYCGACASCCSSSVHTVENEHLIGRERCRLCSSCADNCPTGALKICGDDMSVEDILAIVEKDRSFYGEQGGITLSGGEPFTQRVATVEVLKECKARGLSTAVETCGYADPEIIKKAIPFVDMFLWDLKDTDSERHEMYTGVSNRLILKNLQEVNKSGARIRLRCILVNGVNNDEKHYEKLSEISLGINNFDGLEIIPYHAYGGAKAVFLGNVDNGNTDWIPTDLQIKQAKEFLINNGVCVL